MSQSTVSGRPAIGPVEREAATQRLAETTQEIRELAHEAMKLADKLGATETHRRLTMMRSTIDDVQTSLSEGVAR